MNSLNDMNMDRVEILRLELQKLRDEHRDLDDAIKALEEKVVSDRLSIQRLKKRKLLLKDKIAYLQDQIMPDIIA